MRVRYRDKQALSDTILDFSDSRFSADELIKQVALRLRNNQTIETLQIENAELNEKGANALCQAVLWHESLKKLSLLGIKLCSYPACGEEDYFPKDLDIAVDHFCTMLRESKLTHIEIKDIDFFDRTQRKFEHFDMVDPTVMRDLLTQEKEPLYIKQIETSLQHNPHLLALEFSTVDMDVSKDLAEIRKDMQLRHSLEEVNAVLQGTHATIETYMMPEIFKAFAMGVWVGSRIRRKR